MIPFDPRGLAQRIAAWWADPVLFVREVLGVEPDPWQAQALAAYARSGMASRLALQACAGPGKTAVLAWIGWHFMLCAGDRGSHPKGLAFAVTADNLRDNLWSELARWRSQSRLLQELFEWTSERVFARDHPETWFLAARTWAKRATPEEQGRALSGLHADYVLVLGDEVGDVPTAVLRTAEQALARCKWGRIVVAGNPTSRDGSLYEVATRLRDKWEVIRITGDPDDPTRSSRIPIDWARDQIRLYGRDNPWVKAFILGEFPSSGINTLLTPEEVERAIKRAPRPDEFSWSEVRLGIDVARFGDDETVLFLRQGLISYPPTVMRNARTDEIAAAALRIVHAQGVDTVFIDDSGGYGAGVVDALLQTGTHVMPIQFSGKAIDPRYYNRRSEMWFSLAEWVRRGGALPDDPALVRELTLPTYTLQAGRFRLEEKEQLKRRLKASPDRADALALTFALPDAQCTPDIERTSTIRAALPDAQRTPDIERTSTIRAALTRRSQEAHDYNPLSDEWLHR